MMAQLFPRRLTNVYRGAPVAKWVFVALTVMTIGRSLAHIVLPDGGAQSIATIPLDAFTANGAAAVIHIFALWGLSQLLLGAVSVVVLWRYQALIPFMWLLALIEYSGRLLLTFAKPMQLLGTAPGAVGNYVITPLALIMLILSLTNRGARRLR